MFVTRCLAIIFNGLLVATGVAVLSVALTVHFMVVKRVDGDTVKLTWMVTILCLAGALSIVAAILGLCGVATSELGLPVLTAAVILIGDVLILEFFFMDKFKTTADKFNDYLQHNAKESLKMYDKNHSVTLEWDFYQQYAKCCGFDSPGDWHEVGLTIPKSCCQTPDCDTAASDAIHENGCNEPLTELLGDCVKGVTWSVVLILGVQGLVGVFNILLMITMLVWSCCKYCKNCKCNKFCEFFKRR